VIAMTLIPTVDHHLSWGEDPTTREGLQGDGAGLAHQILAAALRMRNPGQSTEGVTREAIDACSVEAIGKDNIDETNILIGQR